MGLMLYSNGINEIYKPANLVFTEEEILNLFPEFKELKTVRIVSLTNTWCVFGVGNDDLDEYNRLASDLVKEPVFSPVIFVHDTELDPKWGATDALIYKGYDEFLSDVRRLIEETAVLIMDRLAPGPEHDTRNDSLPQLLPIGSTKDKKIIFAFNPDDQSKRFYDADEFQMFSQKVYEYLMKNRQYKEPFTIYSDKKAVIVVETKKVKPFLDTLLSRFQEREEYEICTNLTKMIKEWAGGLPKVPRPKARPKKNPSSDVGQ